MAFAENWSQLRGWISRWPPETVTGIREGLLAVLLFLLTQLIICGIEEALDRLPLNFSAPIIAMTLVFVLAVLGGSLFGFETTENAYRRYLKAPTDLLNRHMSIGFTVPLLEITVKPLATPKDTGLIMSCYLLTGILNSICIYTAAQGVQRTIQKLHRKRRGDPEQQLHGPDINCSSMRDHLGLFGDRSRQCHSETSTLVNDTMLSNPVIFTPVAIVDSIVRPPSVFQKSLGLMLSVLLVITTGLPISVMTGSDIVLDTQLLVSSWLGFLAAQSSVKQALWLQCRPKLRAMVSATLNAVLWTSLVMIGYAWAKTAVRETTITHTIATFVSGTHLANLIKGTDHSINGESSSTMGAGDIALSILNAGIVSWGLKLFECRSQLLSRAGVTVFAVSSAAAAVNVIFWPLLAHATGLRPASTDLAFAARSVTIALGGPALESLCADGSLNAVMVVLNGIIFQMLAGLGAGQHIERINSAWKSQLCRRGSGEDVEKPVRPELVGTKSGDNRHDDADTVAAGVAVGINAAAMGTSHLYEQGSRAAPYSTISMTLFGVMTVVFTSIGPLTRWLVAQVA